MVGPIRVTPGKHSDPDANRGEGIDRAIPDLARPEPTPDTVGILGGSTEAANTDDRTLAEADWLENLVDSVATIFGRGPAVGPVADLEGAEAVRPVGDAPAPPAGEEPVEVASLGTPVGIGVPSAAIAFRYRRSLFAPFQKTRARAPEVQGRSRCSAGPTVASRSRPAERPGGSGNRRPPRTTGSSAEAVAVREGPRITATDRVRPSRSAASGDRRW